MSFTALALLALQVQCWGQQSSAQSPTSEATEKPRAPHPSTAPATPKEFAMQLLERADSELLNLSPAVASTICLQLAQGYGKAGERKKEIEMLEECVRTTTLIQDDQDRRANSQMNIALFVSTDYPAALDGMLAVAEPEVRGMIEGIRLQKDVEEKKFDQAMTRISSIARAPSFPYRTATKLMLALPPERESDRRAVFMAAMENYRQAADDMPRLEDFATLIVRYWKHFPPEFISDAIDDILKRDKKRSEGKVAMSLTIATSQGEDNFSSGYQYRLFQFLPILQEIDPGKAKSLLRDNAALEASLKKFPEGMGSLAPTMSDADGSDKNFSITYNMRPENDPKILEHAKQEREIAELMRTVATDPKEALKRAAALPEAPDFRESSAKGNAFLEIAAILSRKDPDDAKDALAQALKVSKDYPKFVRCNYLLRAAALYLRMEDTKSAAKTLDEVGENAKSYYETDTNRDQPNLAFKLEWPSAAVWRAAAVVRSRLSLTEASQIVSKLPDDEIRINAEVILANSILGTPLPYNAVREKFTKEYPGSFRALPIPNVVDLPIPQ
jgi:hypothetical protein